MIITIKKLETKQGEKGPFWKVETDQGFFYSFDLHLGPGLLPGQWDVEMEQKGNYKHIITAKHVASPTPEKVATSPSPGGPGEEKRNGQGPLDRDTMIARQVALKAAVELAGYCIALQVAGDPSASSKAATFRIFDSTAILKVAAAFNEWLAKP